MPGTLPKHVICKSFAEWPLRRFFHPNAPGLWIQIVLKSEHHVTVPPVSVYLDTFRRQSGFHENVVWKPVCISPF